MAQGDTTAHRDHGGNLEAAAATFGGDLSDWIDLSTGINPRPYPVPEVPAAAWSALPRRSRMDALLDAAREAYQTAAPMVALAGAQGAIQAVPALTPARGARILGPTYNEHAAALRAHGWQVQECETLDALAGADLAVVVNPNNPDGQCHRAGALLDLAGRVGILIIDESFIDPEPENSVLTRLTSEMGNIVVLRSFGKFYGLAGLRLGFAICAPGFAARLTDLAGPWPVSGPAIEIAIKAFADRSWRAATCDRLGADAARLDALAGAAGWRLVGGTPLFRTYETGDAARAQAHLARHRIWSRIFPYSGRWLRLGLTDEPENWTRLKAAFGDIPR